MVASKRISLFTALVLAAVGCLAAPPHPLVKETDLTEARREMVDDIRARGVTDDAVLAAVGSVPRHLFVPEDERRHAYEDHPLPIGLGQTISQPYIVALMTSLLDLRPDSRVLEVGTGSGYQAAVLSRLAGQVYSMEILPPLGERASRTLAEQGYKNVQVRVGDGYKGWPDAAPFDAIIVTAAPPTIPAPLLDQLKKGGKMVIPVGKAYQDLVMMTRRGDGGFDRTNVLPVRFVPMTGEAQKP